MTERSSIGAFETALANEEFETAEDILREITETAPADSQKQPFSASVHIKENYIEPAGEGLESDIAVPLANDLSRKLRNARYWFKTRFGFSGIKIVSEGDSWFQYPVLLDDIIDDLSGDRDKAVYSLGAAGDLLADMVMQRQYLAALSETGAHVFLISGGGNDVLGEGALKRVLKRYEPDASPEDLIDTEAADAVLMEVVGHYRSILDDVTRHHPGVQTFGHAYDLPFPRRDGKWLGIPLDAFDIPLETGRDVIKILVDRFASALQQLAAEYTRFTFVDVRGTVGNNHRNWYDELHPKSTGFARAALPFREAIDSYATGIDLEAGTAFDVSRSALESGTKKIVLDPGHGGAPPPSVFKGSSWNNAIGPNGTLEKTLSFDVCKRAAEFLRTRGYQVELTRTEDVNVGLKDRALVAKQIRADAFVSVHFNASNQHTAQGTETWIAVNASSVSHSLAQSVQAAMVAALGHRDRGLKRRNLGVIRRDRHAPNTAAVLHEVSFMDRADEEAKLRTMSYREKIARAIADGVDAFLSDEFETSFFETDEFEIGDAIEDSADRRSLTVPAHLGYAEAPVLPDRQGGHEIPDPAAGSRHRGGHLLADADTYAADPDLGGSISRSSRPFIDDLLRGIVSRVSTDGGPGPDTADDRNEFSDVPIGDPFDFDAIGRDPTAGRPSLELEFSGLESGGFDYAAFEAFIDDLNLRYFQPHEFLVMGGSNQSGPCAGKNRLPPKSLWPRLTNSAQMLDEIRHRLGAPVRILSCYRSPQYNVCIDGASGSLHKQFNAIDWRCSAGTSSTWRGVAREVRDSHSRFRGGIGLYSSFVHIDTRGYNANW